MTLFRKDLLEKVLSGEKTETRRPGQRRLKVGRTYSARCRRFDRSKAHIRILRTSQQRLGDVTRGDAKKEGFSSLKAFREAWKQMYGSWNPGQIVTVYGFRKTKERAQGKRDSMKKPMIKFQSGMPIIARKNMPRDKALLVGPPDEKGKREAVLIRNVRLARARKDKPSSAARAP